MANDIVPGKRIVSSGESRTVQGPVATSFFDIVGSAESVVDCTSMKGKLLRISVTDARCHYTFSASGTDSIDETKSFEWKLLKPDIIYACSSVTETVPSAFPFLLIKCIETAESCEGYVRRA